MKSLRARLLARLMLVSGLICLAAAATLYGITRGTVVSEFDAALLAKARALAALTEQAQGRVELELQPDPVSSVETGDPAEYFVVLDDRQRVVARTPIPEGKTWPDGLAEANNVSLFMAIRLPDGEPARAVRFVYIPRVEEDEDDAIKLSPRSASILMARSTVAIDRTLTKLAWSLALVFVLTLGAIGVALGWVVWRDLKPLRTLSHRMGTIGVSNLADRVDLIEAPLEIQPVVHRFNALLAEIQMAMQRERSFTADVAHELRTPLAGLTTALQVCGSRPRQAAEYKSMIAKCLKTCHGMHGMVDNLLTLARADAGQLSPRFESADCGLLLEELWVPFEGQATARALHVTWSLDSDLVAHTDAGLLSIVLSNLIDNAVSHADSGGEVHIAAGIQGDSVAVSLVNSGNCVAPADLPRLFDRFYRGDQARNETGRHCGLGLALCKRILDLLGGTIQIVGINRGEFNVSISVPTARDGSPD